MPSGVFSRETKVIGTFNNRLTGSVSLLLNVPMTSVSRENIPLGIFISQ